MREYRKDLESIFWSGIGAVAPDRAILRHIDVDGSQLLVEGEPFWKMDSGRLHVVGAGKGAAPMARAAEALLGEYIAEGLVVVKTGHELALDKIEIATAAHPVPDLAGQAASRRILDLAAKCGPGDLLLCLFTGGASALTAAPAQGLTLADLVETTKLLLASGANIEEINAVRKHLSVFGGGRLAEKALGAKVLALIVSDVIGDDPATIASGPTTPDPSTFSDCMEVVKKYRLEDRVPAAAFSRLSAGAAGKIEETAKQDNALFQNVRNVIVASNRQALEACAKSAEAAGWRAQILTDRLCGNAREAVGQLLENAEKTNGKNPLCLLAGGETTVKLAGKGLGGRNQEMALAASISLSGNASVCALFAGTDGTDGPVDAAGGFAFADTVEKMGGREKAMVYLDNNDSWHALQRAGDLFITGPTLTNVMDLAIILKI